MFSGMQAANPGVCTPPQALLKVINSSSCPKELLSYVETHHEQLDTINLATILYRLAKLFNSIQATEQRASWKQELLDNPQFSLLLSTINTNLVEAQTYLYRQEEVQGLNAWCLSNLLWALVKLDVTTAGNHISELALCMAVSSAPLVIHFLPQCSAQGVGNLLWSYVQIPGSPSAVLLALLSHVITLLEGPQAHVLDAHALSNALWAIAHTHVNPTPALQDDAAWQAAVTKVLVLGAEHCLTMLSPARTSRGFLPRFTDDHLLYQALAVIVWSYGVILGSACGTQEPIKQLFRIIKNKCTARFQLILNASTSGQRLPHTLSASFNGVTLSNLVEAYETAQMLTPELLQAVFDVAAARLSRPSNGPQGLKGFKPEDLAVLLRAASLNICQPLAFVQALSRLLQQNPQVTEFWSQEELAKLQSALQQTNVARAATAAHHQPGVAQGRARPPRPETPADIWATTQPVQPLTTAWPRFQSAPVYAASGATSAGSTPSASRAPGQAPGSADEVVLGQPVYSGLPSYSSGLPLGQHLYARQLPTAHGPPVAVEAGFLDVDHSAQFLDSGSASQLGDAQWDLSTAGSLVSASSLPPGSTTHSTVYHLPPAGRNVALIDPYLSSTGPQYQRFLLGEAPLNAPAQTQGTRSVSDRQPQWRTVQAPAAPVYAPGVSLAPPRVHPHGAQHTLPAETLGGTSQLYYVFPGQLPNDPGATYLLQVSHRPQADSAPSLYPRQP